MICLDSTQAHPEAGDGGISTEAVCVLLFGGNFRQHSFKCLSSSNGQRIGPRPSSILQDNAVFDLFDCCLNAYPRIPFKIFLVPYLTNDLHHLWDITFSVTAFPKIGRASCRERVCQYV